MKKKFISRVLCFSLSAALLFGGTTLPVNAQTLSEAGLTESTRGAAGAGNQNKSRSEESITMKVSVGAGGTDASWTGLAEFTPYIANDGVEMCNRSVTFGDIDNDGDIDSTDLFRKLEDYKRGDIALNMTTSDTGDFYTDVFGIGAGGSFTYWVNGNSIQYGTPDLYDGDNLTLVAFTGDYNAWGSTDDSAYDDYKSSTTYTSMSDLLAAGGSSSSSDPSDPSEPTDHSEPTDLTPSVSSYNTYIKQLESVVASGYQQNGTGMWQQLRILRFAKESDKTAFATYQAYFAEHHGVTLGNKAVDDMRVLSVIDNETAMNNLLYGPGNTIDDVEDSSDAFVYDKAAGMYAMDYILMVLDLTGAGLEDDDMTNNLSDYTTTVSVRDDLVYQILNTSGCWGGSWWAYDTGCQNAQSLVPYYNRYSEVKTKLDAFDTQCYEHFMDDSYTGSSFDASCAGEYVRFAALLAQATDNDTFANHAVEVYNKILSIGLENTKFKGNTMDIWRMATAEWGLGDINASTSSAASTDLKITIDQVNADSSISIKTNGHVVALKDISDVQLVEGEFTVPEGLTVNDVSSTVGTLEYGVDGTTLRVVISNLDGEALNIIKDKDLFTIDLSVAETGEYSITAKSIKFWVSSEESRSISATSEKLEVAEPGTVTVTTLYTGSSASRFISANTRAIKISFGKALNIDGFIQVKIGDNYYNCYANNDFIGDVSYFVALVPVDTPDTTLTNFENYYVASGDAKVVKFGDTDFDGNLTSADALSIVRVWVGKKTVDSDNYILAANVTADSDINNADTLSLVEKIVNNSQFKILK